MGSVLIAVCEDVYDPSNRKEIVDYRVENLSENVLCALFEDCLYNYDEDAIAEKMNHLSEEDLFHLDELTDRARAEFARMKLREALDEIIFNQRRRDTTELFLKDTYWVVTGGMTWGDVPTDAYDLVSLIGDSGVTDDLGSRELPDDALNFKA